jgi:hypothetical protein
MARILIFITLSLIATSGMAAPPASKAPDSTGLYLGGQLGDGIAGGMLGLQLGRSYAIEARYDYIETIRQPNTTIKSSIVGGALLGFYPVKVGDLERPLYLFGKAGYERKTTKTTTTDPGIPGFYPATTTKTTAISNRVMIGAGVQYDFSEDVSGRIGANAIGHDHSVYIAAIYKF